MFTEAGFWVLALLAAAAVRALPDAALRLRAGGLAAIGWLALAAVLHLPAVALAALTAAVAWLLVRVRLTPPGGSRARGALVAVGPLLALWVAGKHAWPGPLSQPSVLAVAGASFLLVKAWTLAKDRADGRLAGFDVWTGAAYLLYLPTYLSGPMPYYGEFAEGLRRPAAWDGRVGVETAFRFLVGLAKVFVVAPLLTPVSLIGLAGLPFPGAGPLLLGALVYSVVLYADFSGYSDLAVVTARVVGVTVPENFNRPYFAPDIREFWRRWHITFSRVLTAYVFVPLTRALQRRTALSPRAIMITGYVVTFGAAGYWHGPTPRFVAWGLYHAAGLIVFDLAPASGTSRPAWPPTRPPARPPARLLRRRDRRPRRPRPWPSRSCSCPWAGCSSCRASASGRVGTMRLVLTDLLPLLALLPVVLAVAAGLAWLEFRTPRRPSAALDRDEWVLLAKLIAIPILVLLLVTARVILTAPAGQFLYGRF